MNYNNERIYDYFKCTHLTCVQEQYLLSPRAITDVMSISPIPTLSQEIRIY